MKKVAIVQARMTSTRLPNKMLKNLNGFPIIEWVYRRAREIRGVDSLVFAITDTKHDDRLEKYLVSIGAKVFRGSENNLVDRFYKVAKILNANQVIRICADNPFICPHEVDRLIKFYNSGNFDYAYNHIPKNNFYPDGLGAEICSMELLEEINNKATSVEHLEHIFNYIWKNKKKYIIKTFNPPKNLAYPNLKLDIDTMDDFLRLSKKDYRIDMSAEEIIKTSLE